MTSPARRRRGRQIRKTRRVWSGLATAAGVAAAHIGAFNATMVKLAAQAEDNQAKIARQAGIVEP